MKLTKILITSLVLTSSLFAAPVEEGFTAIFNGKDLTGWTPKNGTATYIVEDGQIIGTTAKGSPNTFLTSDKHYSDFELRFDVKIDDDQLNSGCQVRSNSSQDYKKGRVHGYQVELEAKNGVSGFIYDEGRRGWLSKNRVDEDKNKAYKSGEWNQIRILCQGDSIKTWVNDVAIADLTDSMTSSGFIGLQVHGVKGDPKWSVRWKNIRIKELPSSNKALYNGKDLTNFKTTGNWIPQEEGILELIPRKGETGWNRFSSYLWAEKQYGDFSCEFEYLHQKGGNSGFYFRVKDMKDPVKTGIEIQILDSHGKKGNLTHHDCGGVIMTGPPAKNMAKPAQQWNKMTIKCEGSHLQVWLNGEKIQDMLLDKTGLKDRPAKGFLGFQDHGVPFQLRNINIKEL